MILSIIRQVNRRKYSPTSKLVLNGCAAPSMEDICSARSSSKFDLQWNQVRHILSEVLCPEKHYRPAPLPHRISHLCMFDGCLAIVPGSRAVMADQLDHLSRPNGAIGPSHSTIPMVNLQVIGNLHVEDGWMHAFTTAASSRNLVARAGVLGPGQLYTFSLSATDSLGSVGYAGKWRGVRGV